MPDAVYSRLESHLEFTALTPGKVVYEPGEDAPYVYFPTEGIVSVLAALEDRTSVEVAIIGNEGFIGTSLLLEGADAHVPLHSSVVHVAGHAYRLRTHILMEEFGRGGELRHWLLRYTQALITQLAQIAVCTRHHAIEAQVCRWLLQRLDRLRSIELYVTHKEIASRLGVRREGVTEAACHLQDAGLIRYSRGHITVLDRVGIEQRACECLGIIQREYHRLLCVSDVEEGRAAY